MTIWNKKSHFRLIGLGVSLVLSGCSLVTIDGKTTEEFAVYVEDVFKLQNNMTTRIMEITDSDEKPKNFDTILQKEQAMQKQCESLNEYATREMDGLDVDLALQKRIADSAKSCETAAKAVQQLLPKQTQ